MKPGNLRGAQGANSCGICRKMSDHNPSSRFSRGVLFYSRQSASLREQPQPVGITYETEVFYYEFDYEEDIHIRIRYRGTSGQALRHIERQRAGRLYSAGPVFPRGMRMCRHNGACACYGRDNVKGAGGYSATGKKGDTRRGLYGQQPWLLRGQLRRARIAWQAVERYSNGC